LNTDGMEAEDRFYIAHKPSPKEQLDHSEVPTNLDHLLAKQKHLRLADLHQ